MIEKPARLVYLSSLLHRSGDPSLDDLTWTKRRWDGRQAYSDSKLHDAILANAIARRWPDVFSNSLEPGWVATKMGGAGAPDDPEKGRQTQVWLAVSDDVATKVSGKYFHYKRQEEPHPATRDVAVQDRLLETCRALSGIDLPA